MAMRNAVDDAVQSETPKVVCHSSDGVVGWIEAQQLRKQYAHFLIVEPAQLETENNQDSEQGLHAFVTEPQGRSSLTVDFSRADYSIEGVLAYRAIVRNLLDVEKTPVGLEADLPQGGQVLQELTDTEVTSIVDGRFSAKGAPFLVILLDSRVLVIDMKGR